MAKENGKKKNKETPETLADIWQRGATALKASYTPDVQGYVEGQPDRALQNWLVAGSRLPPPVQSPEQQQKQAEDITQLEYRSSDEGLSDYPRSVQNTYSQIPYAQNFYSSFRPDLHGLDRGQLSYYAYGNPRTPFRRRAFQNDEAVQNMINYQLAMQAVTNRRRGM